MALAAFSFVIISTVKVFAHCLCTAAVPFSFQDLWSANLCWPLSRYPHSTTPPPFPHLWHPSALLISLGGDVDPVLGPTTCLLEPSSSSCILIPSWWLRSMSTNIWNTIIYLRWRGEKTKTRCLEKSKKYPEYLLILQWFAAQDLSHPEVFPRVRTKVSMTAGHNRENLAPKHSNPSWKAPLLLVLFG